VYKNPLVSICIPTYNNAAGLRRVLNSIADQTYTDYEVIITDDSTTDRSKKVAYKLESQLNSLRYYKNATRLGSPANWNESLQYAKGKYIKIIHHDDWLSTPKSLETMVQAAETTSKPSLVFAASAGIKPNGKQVARNMPSKRLVNAVKANPTTLIEGNIIGAPSAVLYSNNNDSSFNPDLIWLVDIDFYISILSNKFQLIYIEELLINTTTGSDSQVTNSVENNIQIELFENLYLLEKWRPYLTKANYLKLKSLTDKYNITRQKTLKGIHISWRFRIILCVLLLNRIVKRIFSKVVKLIKHAIRH